MILSKKEFEELPEKEVYYVDSDGEPPAHTKVQVNMHGEWKNATIYFHDIWTLEENMREIFTMNYPEYRKIKTYG